MKMNSAYTECPANSINSVNGGDAALIFAAEWAPIIYIHGLLSYTVELPPVISSPLDMTPTSQPGGPWGLTWGSCSASFHGNPQARLNIRALPAIFRPKTLLETFASPT